MPAVVYAVKMTVGLLEEFWQQRFVCLSTCPRCKPHKYPSGRLANDLETPTLHSINISLKSIMSLLNEIKAKCFKSFFFPCVSQCECYPWRWLFFHLFVVLHLFLPSPLSCSLCVPLPSPMLISQRQWERFIKSPKLGLISTVLWIVKMLSPDLGATAPPSSTLPWKQSGRK